MLLRAVLASTLVMTALVVGLLFAHHGGHHWLEWVLKPLAAGTFLVTAVARGALSTRVGTIVLIGLGLAALGDVLLIPRDRRVFLAGIGAFLLGHVAYAVAFVVRGIDGTATTVATAGLALVAAPVIRWLFPHVPGPMRVPVAAYVIVITSMVALAVGTVVARGTPFLLVGALGFYLSDLSVARDRFVAPAFVNRLWGLPLYFYAQLLLASQVGR